MLIAHYTGDHTGNGWQARAGVWITRLGQKGVYGDITHTEAIHCEHSDGSVTIASASLRDGGVRAKRVTLNPEHWIITDVSMWDVEQSTVLLSVTRGMPYDLWGAIATVLPGRPSDTAFFCNRWVGTPYLKAAGTFGPHHFAAICLSIGKDITTDFFNSRAKS
jgi:hypothetical protein